MKTIREVYNRENVLIQVLVHQGDYFVETYRKLDGIPFRFILKDETGKLLEAGPVPLAQASLLSPEETKPYITGTIYRGDMLEKTIGIEFEGSPSIPIGKKVRVYYEEE